MQVKLVDYSVNSVSAGINALATTRVAIRPDGRMASEGFVTSYKVSGLMHLGHVLLLRLRVSCMHDEELHSKLA